MGACLSILFFVLLVIFVGTKISTLYNKHDVDIMSALDESVIDFREKFTSEDGFFLAAGLTEYDTNPEIIEEARYGELILEYYGWGYEDKIGTLSTPLDWHWCSDEELGFNRT
jgi:hypothetical protein